MAATESLDLAALDISDLELWRDDPPHQVFDAIRERPGLHWSELGDFEWKSGFWSVVRFEDVAMVGRDAATFSSERSIVLVDKLETDPDKPDPIDLSANMLITQDPPRTTASRR